MITKTTDFEFVQSLLYEDELINSPMIRLLDISELDIEIWLDDAFYSNGVLFVKSTYPGTWDAAQYPRAWKRVWIQSISAEGVNRLIRCLPRKQELLCKLHRSWMEPYLRERLSLEWKGALLYFTLTVADFVRRCTHSVTRLTPQNTSQATDLLKNSGRSVDHLRAAFTHPDAAVFGILRDGRLVSGAFVDPRTKRTLEICAVYTDENYRGQGLAASVVSVATEWILRQGKLPVYATRIGNSASQRLAQSIGYTTYGQVHHYYCPGLPGHNP